MNRRRVNLENCLYGSGTEGKISVEGDYGPQSSNEISFYKNGFTTLTVP
jgi:hypothetical protein